VGENLAQGGPRRRLALVFNGHKKRRWIGWGGVVGKGKIFLQDCIYLKPMLQSLRRFLLKHLKVPVLVGDMGKNHERYLPHRR